MDPVVSSAAQSLALGDHLLNRALEGLGDEDLHRRPSKMANSLIWVAAHMVFGRISLAGMLGAQVAVPWGNLFKRGASAPDPESFPKVPELKESLARVNEALAERFEALTETELSRKAPVEFPVSDKTLRGAISFMAYHDGYHAGQLSYVLKLLGRDGLVG